MSISIGYLELNYLKHLANFLLSESQYRPYLYLNKDGMWVNFYHNYETPRLFLLLNEEESFGKILNKKTRLLETAYEIPYECQFNVSLLKEKNRYFALLEQDHYYYHLLVDPYFDPYEHSDINISDIILKIILQVDDYDELDINEYPYSYSTNISSLSLSDDDNKVIKISDSPTLILDKRFLKTILNINKINKLSNPLQLHYDEDRIMCLLKTRIQSDSEYTTISKVAVISKLFK